METAQMGDEVARQGMSVPWGSPGTNQHPRAKKRVRSPLGLKPDCDNCAKAAQTCECPMPGRARCCKWCQHTKMKCTVGRAPMSMKRV